MEYEVGFKTEHGDDIKNLFHFLEQISPQITLDFVDDKDNIKRGVRIVHVDIKQKLMVYVKLYSDKFVVYKTKSPVYRVPINLTQINKDFKNIINFQDSIMHLDIDEKSSKLKIKIKDIPPDNIYNLEYPIIGKIDDSVKMIPSETEFEITVLISTQYFSEICQELSTYSEYVEIECTKQYISFKCCGKNDDKTIVVSSGNDIYTECKIRCLNPKESIVSAIYKTKELCYFLRCSDLCDYMQLFLRNNYPLFFQCMIGSLGKMLVGLNIWEKIIIEQQEIKKTWDEFDETGIKIEL